MSMVTRDLSESPVERPRYVERRAPIVFPVSAEMPESLDHVKLRWLLFHLLERAIGSQVTVGCDQFVYYDAADPSACVAPDVYVSLTPQSGKIRSWKVWERGAPQVAVEIISASDASARAWETKLDRYRHLGVAELVRYAAEDATRPLRVWDRVDGELAEREVPGARASSLVLDLEWVVAPAMGLEQALRIERRGALIPTAEEAEQLAAAAHRAEAGARRMEAEARQAAEKRVKELEEELRRRG